MEPGIGRHRRNRHYVADLGEELVPPLMREDLLEWRRPRAALDRPASGDGIAERVVRVGVAPGSGEVDMIRQPLGRQLAGKGGAVEDGIVVRILYHRCRRLQRAPSPVLTAANA